MASTTPMEGQAAKVGHPLTNVIWQSLGTEHARFARENILARKFIPEVSSLASLAEPSDDAYHSLGLLMANGESAALALDTPRDPPAGWTVVRAAPMLQMVHQGDFLYKESPLSSSFLELNASDAQEMLALAKLTQPGPFSIRTHELGTYLGIRRHGALIAMAGERLKIPGFTEVSAVCTHPDHTGRGYARALMSEVMKRIRDRSETPFLHVRQENRHPIELYQRLGFVQRVLLHLSIIRRDG